MKLALFSRFAAGYLAVKCAFWRFLSFLVMCYLEFSKCSKMNTQTVLMMRQMSPGPRASAKKLEKDHLACKQLLLQPALISKSLDLKCANVLDSLRSLTALYCLPSCRKNSFPSQWDCGPAGTDSTGDASMSCDPYIRQPHPDQENRTVSCGEWHHLPCELGCRTAITPRDF